MANVVFNNVSKRFDGILALADFSLTIADGEFVVLVGPSGCGKSTALRLLAGLEDVTAGEILIDDKVVNHVGPQQRNVAMVFQNYALYPHMNVHANLAFPLRMSGMPANIIDTKVNEIAGILDLSELLTRKPKQLSGGQRQRVAMGRALVRDPSVFLLDEPLSNLDARLRAQIRADIANLQRRLRKSTLYVTHDQVEAMTLGHRVAVMRDGQLQQVATPEVLYREPANVFVARFIGSPGMNIMPSTLIKQTDNTFAIRIGNQTLTLLPEKHHAVDVLAAYLNQPIFVGIRPEAFHARPPVNGIEIKLRLQSVEFLGHESLIYLQLFDTDTNNAGEHVIARVAGKYVADSNNEAAFFVDPADIYLFDSTGRSILSESITHATV
ncbi:ABC transporter ATP-binding protein [Kaarinaea lacus]